MPGIRPVQDNELNRGMLSRRPERILKNPPAAPGGFPLKSAR